MDVTVDFINGLAFGLEYVPANDEMDMEFPCIIADVGIVRFIIELTGSRP